MPDNHEAIDAKNSDDKIVNNERPGEVSKIIEGQKFGENSAQEETVKNVVSEGTDSPVANKVEPFKRFPRRDNRTSRFGQSSGGNYDAKESQRHSRYRKKICRFCLDKNSKINYRDSQILGNYITERGKILPRRITGTCSKHQREVSKAIKRARILAVLPFSVK